MKRSRIKGPSPFQGGASPPFFFSIAKVQKLLAFILPRCNILMIVVHVYTTENVLSLKVHYGCPAVVQMCLSFPLKIRHAFQYSLIL